MDFRFLVVGLVVFLGLTGFVVKSTDFAEPCEKIDFKQDFKDGNLTVTNTGDVRSGGRVTGYIEIGEDLTKIDEDHFGSLDAGKTVHVELDGQIAVLEPYKCSSKSYEVKTDSKKLTECVERKTTPEVFKECSGIR